MNLYGYDINGLMIILGKAVVANNRLMEESEIRDRQIEALKKQVADLEDSLKEYTEDTKSDKKESTKENERLGTAKPN